MTRAMYAFSGDPITYGHINVVERAAKIFDELIVGIGVNPDKKYMFSLNERLDMANRTISYVPNAQVTSFGGLLVDYAYENDIAVIVKGIRNSNDAEYERVLHQIGDSQKLGIETIFLPADEHLAHVSSSAVKALQKEKGFIHEYVPLYVKQCLEARMSNQYIIGVTGTIAAGKSTVSNKFQELGTKYGINVHNIELDHIGHHILGDLKEPAYCRLRETIAKEFGEHIMQEDGMINRKALGEIVFGNSEKLDKLNEMMLTPMMLRLRRDIYDKKGLLLIDAALIAESDMTYLCNNNVILLDVDETSQTRRLKERGHTEEQIKRRVSSQYSTEEKRAKLQNIIQRDNQGKIWTVDNSDGSEPTNIEKVFQAVLNDLKVK